MKKKFMAVTVAAMMTLGVFSVSAAETDNDFKSNMDKATYLEVRTNQLDKALLDELITADEYNELIAHIEDVVETEAFGNGPQNGGKGDGNATCVLDDNDLGIFSSESAGMRTGSGNGVGEQSHDGAGAGNGNKAGNGNASRDGNGIGAGNGNGLSNGEGAGNGNGQRLQNSENCEFED